MTLPDYLAAIDKQFRTGIAREHAYRGDLQHLLRDLCPRALVTNEPARIACGAPDLILTRQGIPAGYVEAKDIGANLGSKSYKEQFERYRASLDNLIITDYLEFRFFRNGGFVGSIRIGEVQNGRIRPLQENFAEFIAYIEAFASWRGQSITSAKKLAAMMASKARLLARIVEAAVRSDAHSQANTELRQQLDALRTILIHDITPKGFADLYAQTIAYGMFAARLHDPSPETFSRMEAAQLIPRTNPFLRKLFQSLSGYDLDSRITWIVDALADIFRATDIGALLRGFGKSTGREDAFMHFYEDFLAQYDPKLRKSRGVWYTPDAAVRFIVSAVDSILQSDFQLPMGLGDESTVKIKRTVHTKATPDRRSKGKDVTYEEIVHRVQLLDPATGTGTFLAEVVRQVHSKFQGQQGTWPQYVEQHLIPRLNGFELLMASYAMAHLKLDLVLRDTGYDTAECTDSHASTRSREPQRLRIFLTNSLEEAHPDTGTLFANWLSQEANEANGVKRDTPVMVVLGNPPYSGISSNMGGWISSLIEPYKYVDGEHFGERKHWLHDDYVKFIRYGEHFIEKTGEGVLAYINNHSFLDNPTFRGMRFHLLNTFDKIYVIDLHGSSKKAKLLKGGAVDENVFDIQQGVSINIFVKNRKRKTRPARVYYTSVISDRQTKYRWLEAASIDGIEFEELQPSPPHYFFSPVDLALESEYQRGIITSELFPLHTMGFASAQDRLTVAIDKSVLQEVVENFRARSVEELRALYQLNRDSRDWTVPSAKADIVENGDESCYRSVSYRPFDTRSTYYTGVSRGFYASPQRRVMQHLLGGPNYAFCTCRLNRDYSHTYLIARHIVSKSVISSLDNAYVFPLFLYPDEQSIAGSQPVRPNIDPATADKLGAPIGLTFTYRAQSLFSHGEAQDLTPLDVLDYCYAVLHSRAYREKFRELLKNDFPRVSIPTDLNDFRSLVRLGAQLRQLHLLEAPGLDSFLTTYPITGSNSITRPIRDSDFELPEQRVPAPADATGTGRVWINDTQYFDGVPKSVWLQSLGGYQPAQKWLKDRRGYSLTLEDIRHYQRIIVALERTQQVMRAIDDIRVV